MKKFPISTAFAASCLMAFIATAAVADVIDDNVAKAQRSLENAQKRLAAAKECQKDRENCLAEMIEKAQKSAERATKRLADLQAK